MPKSQKTSKNKKKLLFRTLRLKKRYDLPFKKDTDTGFLITLIALMSFLAVLAASGSFTLNAMTDRWSTGLENKATIEISAQTKLGTILSQETINREVSNVLKAIESHAAVKSYKSLEKEEIAELISPWLGTDFALDEIPLPGIISLDLYGSSPDALESLKNIIEKSSPHAVLDTHRDWLDDLIGFVHTLEWIAVLIGTLVAIITVTAISSGIRSRMAIHRDEVEILHLIGAPDKYISRQFQRHAAMITLQGSLIGTAAGILITFFIILLSNQNGSNLLPQLTLSTGNIIFLAIIPLLTSALALITARFTVLRSLALMP